MPRWAKCSRTRAHAPTRHAAGKKKTAPPGAVDTGRRGLFLGGRGDGVAGLGYVLAHARHGIAALQHDTENDKRRQHDFSAHDLAPGSNKENGYQATRTRSSPRPSTPPVIKSPWTTAPTPSGVPVKIRSPAFSSNRPDR